MKKFVIRVCVVMSTLYFSTALFSAGTAEEGCSATAYCFNNGVKYDEVTCSGELSCVAFYEGVDCDGEKTVCVDPLTR